LARQARQLGVPILCGSKLDSSDADIWATGPRAATLIAAGYTFETEHDPVALGLLDNSCAPGGYAYVLVADGRGTLATVLARSFDRARPCLEKTRSVLTEKLGLDMRNLRRFGGIGQFRAPGSSRGPLSSPGEAGGFQDLLFGFGIRLALTTGHLSARSLIERKDLEQERRGVNRILRASMSNRLLLELGGTLGHRYLIREASRRGPRVFLADWYQFGVMKAALYPLARLWIRRRFANDRELPLSGSPRQSATLQP